jgi:hypothetical protein
VSRNFKLYLRATLALNALTVAALVNAATDPSAAWKALSAPQQQALAPLQRDWGSIDSARRQKWLEVAARFPTMPADERVRVQARMAEWARLTPAERTQARLQFQEVRQLPAEERNAKWQAYRALPEAERKSLAQRATPQTKVASGAERAPKSSAVTDFSAAQRAAATPMVGSIPASRQTAPIVVQARPGATTTTMSVRTMPSNQPHANGAPKIAATSSHVDPATLLPRRTTPPTAASSNGSSDTAEQ